MAKQALWHSVQLPDEKKNPNAPALGAPALSSNVHTPRLLAPPSKPVGLLELPPGICGTAADFGTRVLLGTIFRPSRQEHEDPFTTPIARPAGCADRVFCSDPTRGLRLRFGVPAAERDRPRRLRRVRKQRLF
ncbi:unnamed protein product [Ectocarpus sp. 6 AP-2014]